MNRFTLLLALFVTLTSFGQVGVLEGIWSSGTGGDLTVVQNKVSRVLESSEKYEGRGELRFLKAIFQQTQRELLRNYVEYAGIEQLTWGSYDCLTATSLFAEILGKSGFSFSIIETNYHIFLLVHTVQGDVLLETTDRYNGFVTNQNDISARIGKYKMNVVAAVPAMHSYKYKFSLYQEVSVKQLTGLLYFNQAVKAYNTGDLLSCAQKLSFSYKHYPSPRVIELTSILMQTVSISRLMDDEKHQIKNHIREIESYIGSPIASR